MTELFNAKSPELACKIPDGTRLLAYRGSIAHNMYVPNSDPNSIDDVDLMGVVIAPVEHYLGLDGWGSTGTREYKENQYDCVFYEIRKFFSLLLNGNPNVIGLLWTKPEHFLFRERAGQRIIDNRDLFIGKHVEAAFAGYAHAQLMKMETRDPAELRMYMAINREMKLRGIHPNQNSVNTERPLEDTSIFHGEDKDVASWKDQVLLQRWVSYHKKGENIGYLGEKRKRLVLEHGYDTKNAAHCIRLLRMCREFLRDGVMNVYREDAAELLDIKRGKWTLEDVKTEASGLLQFISRAKDRSRLPEKPDREKAGKLLVEILRDELGLTPERRNDE